MTKPRLVTISVSHFCEKARWALDRAGVSYVERAYLPGAHLLPAWLTGGGHSVPVLVNGGRAIPDSTAILKHVDESLPAAQRLFPADPAARAQVAELEDTFDTRLGPATRRWAYFHLLPERQTTLRTLRRASGRLMGAMLPLLFPLVRRLIRVAYRINPESAARSLQRIREVFSQVDGLLQDGRPYLVGAQFSAADLTFATLAGPVVFPAETRAVMPALTDLPPEMARVVADLRASAAGRFALRMYQQHRRDGRA